MEGTLSGEQPQIGQKGWCRQYPRCGMLESACSQLKQRRKAERFVYAAENSLSRLLFWH